MGGNIGEVDFSLQIGRRSGIDCVFLRALVDDCAHVAFVVTAQGLWFVGISGQSLPILRVSLACALR